MTAEYSAFGSKRVRGAGGWAGGRVEVAGKLTPGSGGVQLVGVHCSLGQVGVWTGVGLPLARQGLQKLHLQILIIP